jgi:regulator of protease activity HflC (stomatin/prohibitin superfamily)
MAEIRFFPLIRHARCEASTHVLVYENGKLKKSGRGLNFWFMPLGTAIAEIPMDDRDFQFLFHGNAKDHQDVTVQGVITYRVADPEKLASRIDFGIDVDRGVYLKQPIDQIAALLTGITRQSALAHLAKAPVQDLLAKGLDEIQSILEAAFEEEKRLQDMGLEVVLIRVYEMKPTAELEKALQTPTREGLQQEADKAVFERRALAVERERAIAENELQNKIELARREEQLINQKGHNERRRATEEAETKKIEMEAAAGRILIEGKAAAERIRTVDFAKAEAEKARMDIYRDLPPHVLLGLAAQELAGKLQNIEHLNITPDMLGPALVGFLEAAKAGKQPMAGK